MREGRCRDAAAQTDTPGAAVTVARKPGPTHDLSRSSPIPAPGCCRVHISAAPTPKKLVRGISAWSTGGGPSVRSGAAERPKSTVGVDLHMCFAVDHIQDQPVRPDDERGALDRSDEREKAWGDPVRAGHRTVFVG
jgi:hypothetical protein